MSNYTKITNFASKDSGALDANRLIVGTTHDNEYNAISTAIATKADLISPAFTTPNIAVASGTSLTLTSAVSATQYTSTIATGTAPLVVASTTEVANLKAATATLATSATTAISGSGVSFSNTMNGQTSYTNAGLVSISNTGDVHIGLRAEGSTATSIKHTRGGSGISIVATDGTTLASVTASSFVGTATNSSSLGGVAAAGYSPIISWTTQVTPFPGAGVSITQSHSLGTTNFVATLELVNITAEGGWVTGDVVQWGGKVSDGSTISEVWKSTTQVGALNITGSSTWLIRNKSTGANLIPTPANWAYRFALVQ